MPQLFMKLASQRLDALYEQWRAGTLKSHPYAIARRNLAHSALKAYWKSYGGVCQIKEFAYHDLVTVDIGYGKEAAELISQHLEWRAGAEYHSPNYCQPYSGWGYMPWSSVVMLVHLLGGNPDGHIG